MSLLQLRKSAVYFLHKSRFREVTSKTVFQIISMNLYSFVLKYIKLLNRINVTSTYIADWKQNLALIFHCLGCHTGSQCVMLKFCRLCDLILSFFKIVLKGLNLIQIISFLKKISKLFSQAPYKLMFLEQQVQYQEKVPKSSILFFDWYA